MLSWVGRVLRRFRRDRRAVAALEFFFCANALVILLLGTYDISEAVLFYQETYNAAHSIAASVSNIAVNTSNGSTSLTYTQIQEAESEIWGQVPTLRNGRQNGTKSVTVSSVVFEPTFVTSTCLTGSATTPCYVPVVLWSVAYAGGNGQAAGRTFKLASDSRHLMYAVPVAGADYTIRGLGPACSNLSTSSATTNFNTSGVSYCFGWTNGNNTGNALSMFSNDPLRPCDGYAQTPQLSGIPGSLNQTLPSAGSASDLTTLRTLNLTKTGGNVAPPSPITVVDVHLQYKPIIGLVIGSSVDFYVSAYWPVRSVQADATGTATPLTLYQQFTTISESSVFNDATQAAVEPIGNWCVNEAFIGATVP